MRTISVPIWPWLKGLPEFINQDANKLRWEELLLMPDADREIRADVPAKFRYLTIVLELRQYDRGDGELFFVFTQKAAPVLGESEIAKAYAAWSKLNGHRSGI